VQDGAIVVTIPSSRFRAVYYKPHGQPQLILRERSKTDDYEVLCWPKPGGLRTTRPANLGGLCRRRTPTEADATNYCPLIQPPLQPALNSVASIVPSLSVSTMPKSIT
jgi:hypothetical protein